MLLLRWESNHTFTACRAGAITTRLRICIPFFTDQNVHAAKVVREKLGLSLDYKEITTENFLRQIREVLGNLM